MQVEFWQRNNCERKANAIRVDLFLNPKENSHHVGRLLKGEVSKIVSTGSFGIGGKSGNLLYVSFSLLFTDCKNDGILTEATEA
jgi:hypothetical protein